MPNTSVADSFKRYQAQHENSEDMNAIFKSFMLYADTVYSHPLSMLVIATDNGWMLGAYKTHRKKKSPKTAPNLKAAIESLKDILDKRTEASHVDRHVLINCPKSVFTDTKILLVPVKGRDGDLIAWYVSEARSTLKTPRTHMQTLCDILGQQLQYCRDKHWARKESKNSVGSPAPEAGKTEAPPAGALAAQAENVR